MRTESEATDPRVARSLNGPAGPEPTGPVAGEPRATSTPAQAAPSMPTSTTGPARPVTATEVPGAGGVVADASPEATGVAEVPDVARFAAATGAGAMTVSPRRSAASPSGGRRRDTAAP